jgi:hypothetical protein
VTKHPVVLNAVAQKAGFESHMSMVAKSVGTDSEVWKAVHVPHDPRKKGAFSNCSTCGRLVMAKQRAFSQKDAATFRTVEEHDKLHYDTFMARRDLHNQNMALAAAHPDEVVAICMDAIDRKKLDQPYLSRAVRRNKQFKDKQKFRSHCIGGIAHGHKEERFLFCHDDLIGNGGDVTGAGMNATLTVLMLYCRRSRSCLAHRTGGNYASSLTTAATTRTTWCSFSARCSSTLGCSPRCTWTCSSSGTPMS